MVLKYSLIAILCFAINDAVIADNKASVPKRINYAELPPSTEEEFTSENSCLIKAYWLSISSNFKQSRIYLNNCNECRSHEAAFEYYCYLISANNYFWSGNYQAAGRVYYSMANNKIIHDAIGSEQLIPILNLAQALSMINIDEMDILSSTFSNGYFLGNNDVLGKFIIDTGALIGTVNRASCSSSKTIKSTTMIYDGEVKSSKACLVNLSSSEEAPLLMTSKTIFGQAILRNSELLIFNNKKSNSVRAKMYKDGPLIFFVSDIEYKAKRINNIKVCLDSGAKITTLMPSIYKMIRKDLKGEPIKQISMMSPLGKATVLGKSAPSLDILINDHRFEINNSIAVFRNNSFNQCDIVFGANDIKKTVNRINYKHSLISFN